MLVLTFTASTISDCSDHGIRNDERLARGFISHLFLFCLSRSGHDVPGGEEAGPPGPGGPERAGEVAQSHQNHRLRPGTAAGRRREGVQRRRGQGWCKWRRERVFMCVCVFVCVCACANRLRAVKHRKAAYVTPADISSK